MPTTSFPSGETSSYARNIPSGNSRGFQERLNSSRTPGLSFRVVIQTYAPSSSTCAVWQKSSDVVSTVKVEIEPSPLDPLPEVVDGGAGLRAYMETRGHKLEIVESSRALCTIRMTVAPLGARPLPLTVTADSVKAAGWSSHPVWRADPQRFLAAAATRIAAKKILSGEAFVTDEERPMLWTSGRRRSRRRAA